MYAIPPRAPGPHLRAHPEWDLLRPCRPAPRTPAAVSPAWDSQLTRPRRAQLMAASTLVLPRPSPLFPPPSPLLPPPSSGASGAGPEPREPGRRVSEERYKRPRGTAKVPAAESPPGRAAAAEEEENAEAGRTPARADRRRAAAPGSRCLLLALSLRGHPRPRDGNSAGADPAGQGADGPKAQSEAGEAVRAGQRAGLPRHGHRPGGDCVQPLHGRQPPAGRGGRGGRAAGRPRAEGPRDPDPGGEKQAAGCRPLQPGARQPAARLLRPLGARRGRGERAWV